MIIFLDRDGIINHDSDHYIKNVNEFIFISGSIDAIVRLNNAGYRIGIATNQSGVARGLYDEQQLAAIHNHMLTHIRAAGGDIAAIEYCPHHPDQHCMCRKPNPGMLQALERRLNCHLANVPFLGDKISDIQAAIAVGAQPILISSSGSEANMIREQQYPHVPLFKSLAHYVDHLLGSHKQ